ncbi:hypothetical protein ACFDTO_22465 [Microbacteriaceae bacterium 4G12]
MKSFLGQEEVRGAAACTIVFVGGTDTVEVEAGVGVDKNVRHIFATFSEGTTPIPGTVDLQYVYKF